MGNQSQLSLGQENRQIELVVDPNIPKVAFLRPLYLACSCIIGRLILETKEHVLARRGLATHIQVAVGRVAKDDRQVQSNDRNLIKGEKTTR